MASFVCIPSREYTNTVKNVHYLHIIVTNTSDKFEHHSTSVIQDISLNLLKKIDELLRQLRYGPETSRQQQVRTPDVILEAGSDR
jgi:hypothetical protein